MESGSMLYVWTTRENWIEIVCTLSATLYSIDIAHMYSSFQDLSHGTLTFDLMTLTLKFDLLLKNFNIAAI